MDLEDDLRESFEALWDFIEHSHRIAALGRPRAFHVPDFEWNVLTKDDVQPDFIVE